MGKLYMFIYFPCEFLYIWFLFLLLCQCFTTCSSLKRWVNCLNDAHEETTESWINMLAYFHSWTSWFLLHSGVLVWEPMRQIIKSVRLGTRSRLWFVVGLLRVLLIKQTFRNWLISITSAKQRSSVLTDVEQQNNPYQMVLIRWCMWESTAEGIKQFCHVPSDCKRLPLFCALLIRVFWQHTGLLFIRKCQLLKLKSFSDTVQFSVKFCLRKTSILIAYLVKSMLFGNSFFFLPGVYWKVCKVSVLSFSVLSYTNAYSLNCKHKCQIVQLCQIWMWNGTGNFRRTTVTLVQN